MYVIKDYKVVSEKGIADLEKHVKEAIKDGWQPFGGVSSFAVHNQSDGRGVMVYSQAMVIYNI
jgi:hypothetical protein